MSAILDLKHRSQRRSGGKWWRRREGEPIEVQQRRFGTFPKTFMHRGRIYTVQAVERCWTVSKRGGRVERHHFRVRCRQGTFELYQNVQHDTWYLKRRVARPS